MGNFSKNPFQELQRSRSEGYVGLHIEQGVPVLDRDLNLLADLVSSSVRDILASHLGSGVADQGDAFAVEAATDDNNFRIAAPAGGGDCLVAGIQVKIAEPLAYAAQDGVDRLTTPSGDRRDVAYLDVWVEEVDASEDDELANASDLGVQTSVRLRPTWRVRVAEGTTAVPTPEAGHAHCALALLERRAGERAITEGMIVDLRQTGLRLADLVRRVQRLEDVLFPHPLQAAGTIRPSAADTPEPATQLPSPPAAAPLDAASGPGAPTLLEGAPGPAARAAASPRAEPGDAGWVPRPIHASPLEPNGRRTLLATSKEETT